jgi:large subunit ribosomal protein L19
MQNAILEKVEQLHRKPEIEHLEPGDQIKVHVKIREGEKERIQIFEGILIARNNTGIKETITVRKISFSQGVERIFPRHSPAIEKIEVVKRNQVRRAKLYYLRDLKGKAARLKERDRH